MTDTPKPIPPHQIITDAYQKCYIAEHGGQKPSWVDADFKHCKDLLRQFEPQVVADAICYMFDNLDEQWSEWTGVFMSLTSQKFLQKAIGKMKSGVKTTSDLFSLMKNDYYKKYGAQLIADRESIGKLQIANKTYASKILRAMWLQYLRDEPEPDLRAFVTPKVLNRTSRIVAARIRGNTHQDWNLYCCERTLRDESTGHLSGKCNFSPIYQTAQVDVLPDPCPYCGGKLIKEQDWHKENLVRWIGSQAQADFMRTHPQYKNKCTSLDAVIKDTYIPDDDLDDNFL